MYEGSKRVFLLTSFLNNWATNYKRHTFSLASSRKNQWRRSGSQCRPYVIFQWRNPGPQCRPMTFLKSRYWYNKLFRRLTILWGTFQLSLNVYNWVQRRGRIESRFWFLWSMRDIQVSRMKWSHISRSMFQHNIMYNEHFKINGNRIRKVKWPLIERWQRVLALSR